MPPTIGNGRIDAIQHFGTLTLADTSQPCLAISWSASPVAAEMQTVTRHAATIAIDANGSGSKLLVTLAVKRRNFGSDLADLTHAISVGAAKVAWTSTTASGTATASTFKDVADLISELPGFKCWVLNAPHLASVNSDDFMDLTETYIMPSGPLASVQKVLYRDVSEYVNADSDKVAWMRVGLPEARDANPVRLIKVAGTTTGHTNGTVKLYRDTYAEGAGEVYLRETQAAALTKYADYTIENAPTLRGPLILEVASDDLSVCSVDVLIQQALLGA
jgi:hypothetical protein